MHLCCTIAQFGSFQITMLYYTSWVYLVFLCVCNNDHLLECQYNFILIIPAVFTFVTSFICTLWYCRQATLQRIHAGYPYQVAVEILGTLPQSEAGNSPPPPFQSMPPPPLPLLSLCHPLLPSPFSVYATSSSLTQLPLIYREVCLVLENIIVFNIWGKSVWWSPCSLRKQCGGAGWDWEEEVGGGIDREGGRKWHICWDTSDISIPLMLRVL